MAERKNLSKDTPGSEYYERPYLPSEGELDGYSSVPLLPVEAHTILSDNVGRKMSVLDRLTLQKISDMEEGDFSVDFLKLRRQLAEELGIDEDED